MNRGIKLRAFVSHGIPYIRIRCRKFDIVVLNALGDDECDNTKNCICDRTVLPILSTFWIP
jgi:hypothetical protein